jgi:hypothetical protein
VVAKSEAAARRRLWKATWQGMQAVVMAVILGIMRAFSDQTTVVLPAGFHGADRSQHRRAGGQASGLGGAGWQWRSACVFRCSGRNGTVLMKFVPGYWRLPNWNSAGA